MRNDAARREAPATGTAARLATTEFSNLYPLQGPLDGLTRAEFDQKRRALVDAFATKLRAAGWLRNSQLIHLHANAFHARSGHQRQPGFCENYSSPSPAASATVQPPPYLQTSKTSQTRRAPHATARSHARMPNSRAGKSLRRSRKSAPAQRRVRVGRNCYAPRDEGKSMSSSCGGSIVAVARSSISSPPCRN